MKRLYVCGGFKFLRELEELECKLKEKNIEYETSKKMNNRGILGCLEKVADADVVYVVNPRGYVGIVSESINRFSKKVLVNKAEPS